MCVCGDISESSDWGKLSQTLWGKLSHGSTYPVGSDQLTKYCWMSITKQFALYFGI